MTAATILASARDAGLSVHLEQGKLTAEGPTAALAQWVPELRAVKPALVALLADPAAADSPNSPASPASPPLALVSCRTCTHYLPNPRGFGGLGRCLIAAPASFRPGSLWPRGEIRCKDHREGTPLLEVETVTVTPTEAREVRP